MNFKKLRNVLLSLLCTVLFIVVTTPSNANASSIRQPWTFGWGYGVAAGALDNSSYFQYGTGLSTKLFIDDRVSVQTVLGVGGAINTVHLAWPMIHPDLLVSKTFSNGEKVEVAGCIGGGLNIPLDTFPNIGKRFYDSLLFNGVAGLEIILLNVPMDMVIEWRPSLPVGLWEPMSPSMTNFGMHFRYYYE